MGKGIQNSLTVLTHCAWDANITLHGKKIAGIFEIILGEHNFIKKSCSSTCLEITLLSLQRFMYNNIKY